MKNNTKYQIVTSNSSSELVNKVTKFQSEGWELFGPFHAITKYSQNVFSGTQHTRTLHTIEYSQAITI